MQEYKNTTIHEYMYCKNTRIHEDKKTTQQYAKKTRRQEDKYNQYQNTRNFRFQECKKLQNPRIQETWGYNNA